MQKIVTIFANGKFLFLILLMMRLTERYLKFVQGLLRYGDIAASNQIPVLASSIFANISF